MVKLVGEGAWRNWFPLIHFCQIFRTSSCYQKTGFGIQLHVWLSFGNSDVTHSDLLSTNVLGAELMLAFENTIFSV